LDLELCDAFVICITVDAARGTNVHGGLLLFCSGCDDDDDDEDSICDALLRRREAGLEGMNIPLARVTEIVRSLRHVLNHFISN
jgi:hypothetical protein